MCIRDRPSRCGPSRPHERGGGTDGSRRPVPPRPYRRSDDAALSRGPDCPSPSGHSISQITVKSSLLVTTFRRVFRANQQVNTPTAPRNPSKFGLGGVRRSSSFLSLGCRTWHASPLPCRGRLQHGGSLAIPPPEPTHRATGRGRPPPQPGSRPLASGQRPSPRTWDRTATRCRNETLPATARRNRGHDRG